MGRRQHGGETYSRLLDWTYRQASERLAGHILVSNGFSSLDPAHPLGGPDGTKDGLILFDESLRIMAVYMPQGKKPFSQILKKFKDDLRGVEKHSAVGIAFVTNQPLTESEKAKLQDNAVGIDVDIFHLEKLVHTLDRPENYGIRLEYLQIEMTPEEQLSFVHSIDSKQRNEINIALEKQRVELVGFGTGGDSTPFYMGASHRELKLLKVGKFPLYDVVVQIRSLEVDSKGRNLREEIKSVGFNEMVRRQIIIEEQCQTLSSGTFEIFLSSLKTEMQYEIHTRTRNGLFRQKLHLMSKDNGSDEIVLGNEVAARYFHCPEKSTDYSLKGYMASMPAYPSEVKAMLEMAVDTGA